MPSNENTNEAHMLVAVSKAKKKAEGVMKATEAALIAGEQRCASALQARQQAEYAVKEAISELRHIEATYTSGCDSLEGLCGEYGEVRVEVEVALEDAEVALLAANAKANKALVRLRDTEEEASNAVLSLRQAEMEHNQSQQRLARMLGKRVDRVDIVGDHLPRLEGHFSEEQRSQHTDSTLEDQQESPTSHGLARFRAESNDWPELGGSDLLSHPVVKYVQPDNHRMHTKTLQSLPASNPPAQHTTPFQFPAPPGAGRREGSVPSSVRLMGFGRSAKCLGAEHRDAEVLFPAEARSVLEALGGTAPVQVACSDEHALLVAESGEVFAWGDAAGGRLGFGVDTSQVAWAVVQVPVAIESLRGVVVTRVACSNVHSLALTAEGELYAWGQADNGVLGLADTSGLCVGQGRGAVGPYTERPVKVEGLRGPLSKYRVRTMACSDTFNVAVTEGGPAYAWGCVAEGRLGVGDVTRLPLARDRNRAKHCATPVEIEGLRGQRVQRVSCGESHSLAVTEEGEVLAWGAAEYGKLGVGDVSKLPADAEGRVHAAEPLHVDGLRGLGVVSVAAGATHSLAATRDGAVYAWGSAADGKLGQGGLPAEEASAVMDARTKQWWPHCPTPALVHGLRGRAVQQVACARRHSLAATADGEVMGWGLSSGGRLGVGEVAGLDAEVVGPDGRAHLPVQVESLPWGRVEVATSEAYTLLLFSDVDAVDPATAHGAPPLLLHLLAMQRAAEYTDVVLLPRDGPPVPAHAAVLSSVPFFKSRIEAAGPAEDSDSDQWRIELAECSHSAVARAVEYLYTAAFEPGEEVAECLALLQCAAVIGVQPLVRACARRAETLLTPATVAAVWEVAYALELERLKSKCLRFIIDHYDDCRPEKEATIKDTMRRQPAFFDLVLSALAPGPGAAAKLGKARAVAQAGGGVPLCPATFQ